MSSAKESKGMADTINDMIFGKYSSSSKSGSDLAKSAPEKVITKKKKTSTKNPKTKEPRIVQTERPEQKTELPMAAVNNLMYCAGVQRAKRTLLYPIISAHLKETIRGLVKDSIISMRSQGRSTLSASKDLTFACDKARISFFTGDDDGAVPGA
jgi:histone H3/H4